MRSLVASDGSLGSDYPFVCRQDHFHKSRKSQPGITSPDSEAALPPDAERLQLWCPARYSQAYMIIGARSTRCLVTRDFVSANRALLKLITLDAVPNSCRILTIFGCEKPPAADSRHMQSLNGGPDDSR